MNLYGCDLMEGIESPKRVGLGREAYAYMYDPKYPMSTPGILSLCGMQQSFCKG